MFNKKAQGMPMNVIIIAIIVLVVLVIVIAFFAGGFGSITNKIKDLFGGKVQGQALDTIIQTCPDACDNAKGLPDTAQPKASYCKSTFVVDDDSNPNTAPVKVRCGTASLGADTLLTDAEQKRGVKEGGDLGIECDVRCA